MRRCRWQVSPWKDGQHRSLQACANQDHSEVPPHCGVYGVAGTQCDRSGRWRCGDTKSLLRGWWERSSHAGKELGVSYKTKHLHLHQGNEDGCSHKACPRLFVAAVFLIPPIRKNPVSSRRRTAELSVARPHMEYHSARKRDGPRHTRQVVRISRGLC